MKKKIYIYIYKKNRVLAFTNEKRRNQNDNRAAERALQMRNEPDNAFSNISGSVARAPLLDRDVKNAYLLAYIKLNVLRVRQISYTQISC